MSNAIPVDEPGRSRRQSDRRERTADVLVEILLEQGVDTVFGLPGGTVAPIFDALLGRPEIKVVITKHEMSAMFAAAAYARISGKLGVVLVTSGPGVLNAVTGLATAGLDGAPVLLIAGEVSRSLYGKGALQEGSAYSLNVVALTQHVVKLAFEIPDAVAAPHALRRAIHAATSGKRGPVVVTVPLDVSKSATHVPRVSQSLEAETSFDEDIIRAVALSLSRPKKKLIFAGAGARQGRGPELLRALAEKLQCPVMTTPKGKGVFPEDHPLAVGVFGMGGHPSSTEFLKGGAETVLAVGTSLSDLATNGFSQLLLPARTFVHIDIDPAQVGRAYPAHLTICAPAERALEAILAKVEAADERRTFGVRREVPIALASAQGGLISPVTAVEEIQSILPRDAIVTVDSGEHYFFATHYLHTCVPDGFMVMTGLGAMANSIGGAIGAQLAAPGRRVATIVGDGGFLMACAEIATAAELGLPLSFYVFNDHRLGMVELGNMAIFGRTPSYPTGPVNLASLAASLGAQSFVVTRPGQITEIEALRSPGRPMVVDVRVDTRVRFPKNGRFEALGKAGREGS